MNIPNDGALAAAKVWYWANVYKVSTALFALLEIGALERLAAKRYLPYVLAHDLGLSQQALEPILKLLTDVGVLDHSEGGFAISPAIATVLPLLALESFLSSTHIRCNALVEVLRGGDGRDPLTGPDGQELLPTYLAAMAIGARSLAPHLVRLCNPRQQLCLLDLGGADGALAIAMARLMRGLKATVVDRPQVESAFRKRVDVSQEENCRFSFIIGDLRRPSDFEQELEFADVVVLSNVLHLLHAEERRILLQSLRDHMVPGALVLVYDQFLTQDTKVDAARFMIIDWLLLGYRFESTEQLFAKELAELGFVSVSCKRTPTLPGAIVRASVSDLESRRYYDQTCLAGW